MLKTCILATYICQIIFVSCTLLRVRITSKWGRPVKITLLMPTIDIIMCNDVFNSSRPNGNVIDLQVSVKDIVGLSEE